RSCNGRNFIASSSWVLVDESVDVLSPLLALTGGECQSDPGIDGGGPRACQDTVKAKCCCHRSPASQGSFRSRAKCEIKLRNPDRDGGRRSSGFHHPPSAAKACSSELVHKPPGACLLWSHLRCRFRAGALARGHFDQRLAVEHDFAADRAGAFEARAPA